MLAAAAVLCEAVELIPSTGESIAEELKQDFDEQTAKMAATIMVNALVFHENLSGHHNIRSLSQMMRDGSLTLLQVLGEWMKILQVNYWSIFHVASNLLTNINPPIYAQRILSIMSETADNLREVAQSTTW